MNLAQEIARDFRQMFQHPNFVGGDLKTHLEGITLEQAKKTVGDHNSILALTYHIHYYIGGVLQVLEGGTLDIRDKYSYDYPDLQTEAEWQELLANGWVNAERFAELLDSMTEEQMHQTMADEKYGPWGRNLIGLIQHSYYHIGQIGLLKKLV
ncbi:MAG: DinB family protein [Bacteroidota bacterium]